jgi:Flp pilus assembly protein TadG
MAVSEIEGSTGPVPTPMRSTAGERGSALLLAPAGLLILLLLAALCFDLSLGFQRKRQLVELADSAANDAVTYGLDDARLRAGGAYCLAADRVARSVAATVASSGLGARVLALGLGDGDSTGCAQRVAVTLEATSPYPFGAAVPGHPKELTVRATSRATVVLR